MLAAALPDPLRVAVAPARDDQPRRPRMANAEDRRDGLELTDRALVRDGTPWLPVSGELHYTRVPRERWIDRLRLMRAGGISVVSTYVPWIHHEPVRGRPRFHGRFDVASFVDAARAEGLEVMLRIGPWVHGEMRNGGFPDWVQRARVRHRTDDPAYLDLVREWFGHLAIALDGRASPRTILGIQLENELYDQPDHLVTLKRLARDAGMSAPLWTATAWGGADLPDSEVLPLWGGYGDGFWVDPDAPWDATFRAHYFFSHAWDDPGIGADVRAGDAARHAELSPWFPPATCELGGGMATAYHRRPRPTALDVAAIAHVKLGSGSAWQGYYMYSGGTNPGVGLEESQATGYPNDMTRMSYDFHAPIGEAGLAAPSHAALRVQHAFIDAFGAQIAAQRSHLPEVRPAGVDDVRTLRWAFRGEGAAGFLFIGWHQPHVPLPTYRGARFRIVSGRSAIDLPSRPVEIPAGTLARWPIGLRVGGVTVSWATASALTVLSGAVPTLVLTEDAGVPVEVAHGSRVHAVVAGEQALRLPADDGRALEVLVLPARDAARVWVIPGADGSRRLLISDDEVTSDAEGRLLVRTARNAPAVREYADGAWRAPTWRHGSGAAVEASVALIPSRAAGEPSGDYGGRDGRPAAPDDAVLDAHAAMHRLEFAESIEDDAVLRVRWHGDVAQLRVDGATATDRFWDGSDLVVNLHDAGVRPGSRVELRVLPLRTQSRVHLPADAAARVAAADGQLCGVESARVHQRALWQEVRPVGD